LKSLKTALQVTRCLFPSKLPIGTAQFDTWAKSIFQTYNLEDKPGNRHALGSLIMHLGPVTAHKSKRYFYLAITKSLANETAFETMQSLRKEEEAYLAKHMGSGVPAIEPIAQDAHIEHESHTEQAV
jgi:hypothetical protein